ncbi:MAG: type II toxin-antitoxin system VapC family toxin [Acetobacteraceae bacterium]|nr:type II toxin-antitoxin system VapC family toxin [Acetobacteraceae bacterium]
MNYLLDTNVVSEWARPHPDPAVATFLASMAEDGMFLSVVTLAELSQGVDRLPMGRRRSALDEWLENDLLHRFEGRILGIDPDVAAAWGRIMARTERRGRTPGVMDVWIAAIAETRGLTLVTRDVGDFAPLLEHMVNPWDAP